MTRFPPMLAAALLVTACTEEDRCPAVDRWDDLSCDNARWVTRNDDGTVASGCCGDCYYSCTYGKLAGGAAAGEGTSRCSGMWDRSRSLCSAEAPRREQLAVPSGALPLRPCHFDVDCHWDERCSVQGWCRLDTGGCDADIDCQTGQICAQDGRCVLRFACAGDGDCPVGTACSAAGRCMPGQAAFTDLDCPAGSFYEPPPAGIPGVFGTCSKYVSCQVHRDCPFGLGCGQDGVCRFAGACASHADCPADNYCGGSGYCYGEYPCTLDQQCAPGSYCTGAGKCEAAPTCTASGCGSGQYCDGLYCQKGACNSHKDCVPGYECNPTLGRCE